MRKIFGGLREVCGDLRDVLWFEGGLGCLIEV